VRPYTFRMAEASPSVPARDLSRLRIERARGGSRGRSRGLLWTLLVLAVLGALGWAFRDRFAGIVPGGGRPPGMETAVVRRTGPPEANEVTANGYVVARRQAALSTVLSGRLVEVNVEEGDEVEPNAVVARIQHDDYDAALVAAQQATAVARARRAELERSLDASRLDAERLEGDNAVLGDLVAQAGATAERAARDVERNRPLVEKGVLDRGTWDRLLSEAKAADAALAAARARVEAGEASERAWEGEIARRQAAVATADAEIRSAEQAEAEARILVEKTFVRAPFKGVVVHKDAEVGEVVAATGFGGNSRGSVATIVDPETLEVQVELSETRSATVEEGTPAEIRLEASPERAWPGRVRQVWPTADRQKGTVEVRVVFVERPQALKPEMGVRLTFRPERKPDAETPRVFAPRRAVVRRDGRDLVFVVSGGRAVRREVRTGEAKGAEVEVVAGLSGGERVVLDPGDLEEGVEVRREGP
jgi:RND family efflux transporter MFP subunit